MSRPDARRDAGDPIGAAEHAGEGLFHPRRLFRDLRRSPSGLFGLFLVLLVTGSAVFAPWVAPFAPGEGDFMAARLPPMWHAEGTAEHILGTDQLGQDQFSRIVYGARVSLLVGVLGVTLSLAIGVTLGMLAGYFGGWLDTIVTSFMNLLLSIPYLVLVIVVATILGRSLLNVILLFGVTSSPVFIRVARGEVLRLKRLAYVEAAQGLGARASRIIPRHLVPNLIGPLATLATFETSAMIFYEAGLGFLGLSVPPEVPSWGNMLALGRRFLTTHPWLAIFPGLAIAVTTLGINMLGDWLRDAIDPRSGEG
ncbi:MAG: ABC transporter permease [Trueperaceae bacterium]|nr:ABC transporter permease [Trueperaceae bacterium]